jgi:PAS domain S-box-containing protein
VSPAYETIWGRTCASLYASTGSEWLDTIHPDDRARVDHAVRSRASGTYDEVYRIVRPDGAVRWIRDRGFPVRDGDGRTLRFAGVAEDVTDRRFLEAQLRQAQKMESVGHLAGGIAHDFNNLLTAVLGYCELALGRSRDADEELRFELKQIQKAGRQAEALTRQLLTFSRPDLGQPILLDLNATIRNIDQMLQRVIGDDVRLVVTSESGDLGSIEADPGQVEQVVMNLVVNARDALVRGGTISIHTACVELDAAFAQLHVGTTAGTHLMLSVADDGTGMSPETQARIFDPFFTTKPAGKGTGLGLAMVYGIVKNARGAVTVTSELGRGSVFRIYWPKADAKPAAAAATSSSAGTHQGSETILLVEDDESIRVMAARVLRQHGYSVLVAGDAEQAEGVAADASQPIHLLFTDLVMPGADGHALAASLRRSRPEMRILYTSGYAERVGQSSDAPRGTLMKKPYTPTTLLREIRAAFDGQPR